MKHLTYVRGLGPTSARPRTRNGAAVPGGRLQPDARARCHYEATCSGGPRDGSYGAREVNTYAAVR